MVSGSYENQCKITLVHNGNIYMTNCNWVFIKYSILTDRNNIFMYYVTSQLSALNDL